MSAHHFNRLNYTLSNEDVSLELAVLPERASHILAVAGSGARILPLFSKHPHYVTCVDLSAPQLYITELRIESARTLEYVDFLAFWGYPPASATPGERQRLFAKLQLSSAARHFAAELFQGQHWESPLYAGKYEKVYIKLGRIARSIMGASGTKLFAARTLQEQRECLQNGFPHKRLALLHAVLWNLTVFKVLFGYKGPRIKRNIPESVLDNFYDVLERQLARENIYLQLGFFGKLCFSEANPLECDPEIFLAAQEGLHRAEIDYRVGSIIDEAKQLSKAVDFLSFSNVPSYFTGELERTFLQEIASTLAPMALVVARYSVHVPEHLDASGFEDVSDAHRDQIERKKDPFRIAIYMFGSAPGQAGTVVKGASP